MAVHTWIGGGTAPWDIAANWSDDTLPVAGDTELFDQPYGSEVTFSTATETLNTGTIVIAARWRWVRQYIVSDNDGHSAIRRVRRVWRPNQ